MARELLKINLLPESARKAVLTRAEQFHRTPLMAIAGAVMLVLPLLLLVPISFNRQQLRQLEAKIQALEPRRTEVERIQNFLRRLRSQQTAFQGLKQGEGIWSRRLNTLSDVTPDGVWFTEFALDLKKGLVIQGSAIATTGPEMMTVTRLVQDLKANPDFSSAFKQIQIESIKRVQESDFDIVQFTVTCTLPDEEPAS